MRYPIQETKHIFFTIKSKNESCCRANAIVLPIESPDVSRHDMPHFIWYSAVVKAKRICLTQRALVQFEIVAIDALPRLHLVVHRTLFHQSLPLRPWLKSGAQVVEFPLPPPTSQVRHTNSL